MMLVLHVLMLSLLCGGLAEVVGDFESTCGQFFANGKSPTKFSGSQYKQICQTLEGVPYFATFYDTANKIPVYSAYVFEGLKSCERQNKWYIEPELDNNEQAHNEDYEGSGYDRGHLAPVYQANSQKCADATFTLTNAAPQNPKFNRGPWRSLENKIANEMSQYCGNSAYIVTGVVPGGKKMNNRVNVPSHFWTAYCCLDNNKKCQRSEGYIGENKENISPASKTVAELEKELTQYYNKGSFVLFHSSSKFPVKRRKLN